MKEIVPRDIGAEGRREEEGKTWGWQVGLRLRKRKNRDKQRKVLHPSRSIVRLPSPQAALASRRPNEMGIRCWGGRFLRTRLLVHAMVRAV
jgi:hypothetical protein